MLHMIVHACWVCSINLSMPVSYVLQDYSHLLGRLPEIIHVLDIVTCLVT
jgi:hypothetical protein